MWVQICMCNQLCFMFCWVCHDITDVWMAEKTRNLLSYSSGGQTAKIKLLADWLLLRHFSLACRYLTYGCVFTSSSTAHSSSFLYMVVVLQKNSSKITTALGEGNGTPLQYYCLENPMD